MKILVINGPNLNMLGIREPGIYGKSTFADLLRLLDETASAEGLEVEQYQSNHEGDLVDKIQWAYGKYLCKPIRYRFRKWSNRNRQT